MRLIAPTNPKDRFEVYRFFNGLSSEAKEGLDQHHLRVPLVKTFLLEHVSCRGSNRPKTPIEIFQGLGTEIKKIDENFNEIRSVVVDPDSKKTH